MPGTSIVLEHPGRRSARRPRPWNRRRALAQLLLEPLEGRSLLTGTTAAGLLAAFPPNETVDQAWDLGTLSQPSSTLGSVGTGPDGAADVTWYHFQLRDASQVDLSVSTPPGDRPFASVLSLYDSDPGDWNDPYDLSGYRLMAQVQADPTDGLASYSQDLGPGDYYVAISGAGNTAFSPVIAGSGYQGAMGIYELTAGATDLGLAGDGPTMLWADPAAGSTLDSSPLVIRVGLSAPLDETTIVAGQTVQLFAVSAGGVESPIALASTNLSYAGDELQLYPQSPLVPGQYVVQLSGDASQGQSVLAGVDGLPLGEDAQHSQGADESFTFQVDGIDGVAGVTASDDTPATARQLGDVVGAGIIQVAGAIGVDPTAAMQGNAANQVDLYHLQIAGSGRYAMLAEVFAGRIGSELDPGLSLFEEDPSTGQLVFLAGDNNTLNALQGTDGSVPLLLDSALTDGLTAGDYYLAVADGSNTPSPIENQMPGSPGIFDPNVPGSAQNGWSTGPYLLDLMVVPASGPPQVVASSPSAGQVLNQDPTQITVQFSEAMNLQQLAYQAFETSYQTTLSQVFIEGADGTRYEPRFLSYDRSTNTATFEMLDALPDGSYTVHLSGQGGLTDDAGEPIAANDPSGDYVIPFTVDAPAGDVLGSNSQGFRVIAQVSQGTPQDIGMLFPDEIQAGVAILRYPISPAAPGASSAQDQYVFQVEEGQNYSFQLIGDDLPAGAQVSLTDASGDPIGLQTSPDGLLYFVYLNPGTYTISVGGWAAGAGADLAYQLVFQFGGQQDNPPPLVDGPAPALQVSFVTASAPAGGFTEGGPPLIGGPGAGSPVIGALNGSVEGGNGSGVAIGGGAGAVGSSGGSAPAAPSGAPVGGLSQAEAAIALAGLGMGPLGGSGGQAGAIGTPSIQVALNAPTAASPASTSVAVGLVTMTRMFSWDRHSEGNETIETPEPTVIEAGDSPAPSVETLASAGAVPSSGPREARPEVVPAPTTAAGPLLGSLAIRIDPPGTAVPVGPAPAPDAPRSPPTDPATSAGDDASGRANGERVVRWVIAAATLAAVYRGRTVIRGLQWRKGTTAADGDTRPARPIGTAARLPATTAFHPAARPQSSHAAVSRSLGRIPAGSTRP